MRKELERFAESYITRYNPTHNHLRSFDRAALYEIPYLVQSMSHMVEVKNGTEHTITFTNVRIVPPTYLDTVSRTVSFLPEEAHLKSMTYAFHVVCTAIRTKNGIEVQRLHDFLLASIPCMVGSSICNRSSQLHAADRVNHIPDGCFVIRGALKVIPPLKRANWNNPMIKLDKDTNRLTLEIRSCHESRKSFSTYNTSVILMNSGDQPVLDKKLNVALSFFAKGKYVPCVVLFQALGWTPRDAFFAIRFMAGTHWNNEMTVLVRTLLTETDIALMETNHDLTTGPFDPVDAALRMITSCSTRVLETPQKTREFILRGLKNEFLPQVGIPSSNDGDHEKDLNYRKGIELASFAVQLLLVDLGIKQIECRDNFAYCRMDSVGTLISSLFRQVYSQNMKQAKTTLKKLLDKGEDLDIGKIFGNGKTTARMLYCFSTGSWGSRRSGCNRRNVSQALQLFNAQAQLGHMSFFYTTRNTDGKIVSLRQIHPSQAFKICPAATPEGKQCGIVANGACGFMLSVGSSSFLLTNYLTTNPYVVRVQDWKDLCLRLGWENWEQQDVGYTSIRVNGTCIGFLDRNQCSLDEFYDWFSERRRRLDIDPFTSISHTIDNISIYCDRDRVMRFVVKISEIHRLKRFVDVQPGPMDLVAEGLGIFLDANEEQSVSVCASLGDDNVDKYEYVEIDPTCMLSVLAAAIPFLHHNQAPRNTYQVAMGKAACGRGLHPNVMMTQRHELTYPQRPLTDTMMARAFKPVFRSFGINCVVAVKMHDGFPQEDSAVVNRAFLDRGGLSTNHTRLYRDSSKRGSAADRQFYGKINPRVTAGMKMVNYNKIQDNGLPNPGELIHHGDIVIGKANRVSKGKEAAQFRCTSISHSGDTSRVEKTICTFGADAQAIRKVTVRCERIPEIGDKISSRHGQKTTIGLIEQQVDMPFDEETGISPDVIISPTALPSRMTIGMWQEFMTSTLAAMTGEVQDATAFRTFEKERIEREFNLLGMAKPCTRRLRDGRTGRLMKCRIYTGLVYIQVLKQFSKDKLHARARGPRNILTRAPLEGKSRDGGQRIGYMERDCLFGYGASNLIYSRTLIHSDVSTEYFCKRCGFKAIANHVKQMYTCKACGPYAQVREIEISRAFAVFLDELQALMISTRLQLEDVVTEEEAQKRYRDEVMGKLDQYEKLQRLPLPPPKKNRMDQIDFF